MVANIAIGKFVEQLQYFSSLKSKRFEWTSSLESRFGSAAAAAAARFAGQEALSGLRPSIPMSTMPAQKM